MQAGVFGLDPGNSKILLIQTSEPISSRLDTSIFIPNLCPLCTSENGFKLLTIQFLLTDIMNYLKVVKDEYMYFVV